MILIKTEQLRIASGTAIAIFNDIAPAGRLTNFDRTIDETGDRYHFTDDRGNPIGSVQASEFPRRFIIFDQLIHQTSSPHVLA